MEEKSLGSGVVVKQAIDIAMHARMVFMTGGISMVTGFLKKKKKKRKRKRKRKRKKTGKGER